MRYSSLISGALIAGWCATGALGALAPAGKRTAPASGTHAKSPGARPQVKAPANAAAPVREQPADPGVPAEQAEFFENRIRPVLAENCYGCHGPKLQQAGLRVDGRALLLKGTDQGKAAVVPGEPDKSLLIQAVRHAGGLKMPPNRKLPDKVIEDLAEWVRIGAPWPGDRKPSAGATPEDAAKAHWAFQPVRRPAPPKVKNPTWVKTPVDAFILSKLESKGLSPAPVADRRTLIRRASFDLTGLPPTMEEVAAFVNDRAPNAWEKVVDRLLASPRYGERWGRYWLDVARYADTKGYVFQEERRYPYAYTYRDWVIQAFNQDLPYNEFLVRQIAADHLELGEDKSPLAAMGFLTVGRRFLNNQQDIIDDRMDVVFRGTQALTVGCARCHDHKFDPIPTKDYYSLYGVFASSTEPQDLPLLGEPARTKEYVEFEKELKARQAAAERYLESTKATILKRAREQVAESLLAARTPRMGRGQGQGDVPRVLVEKWRRFLESTSSTFHPVFGPWHQFAAIPDAEFAAKAPALAAAFAVNNDPARKLNPAVAKAFEGPAPASIAEVAKRLSAVLTAPTSDQQLVHALDSIGCPLDLSGEEIQRLLNRDEQNQYRALVQKAREWEAGSPVRPARAMVLVDLPRPVTPRVLLRGNPGNLGPEVPRQFLQVVAGPERKPFEKGSGRLELAQMIASPTNPLTSRVMVNRVWVGHFSQGLVRTPSDFGLRSDPPTHPELLDWLASTFVEQGWSMKKLHRLILLSSTYQQSSDGNPRFVKADPENRLLWHFNRRRLDFESMRDTLLAASGKLDLTLGGPAVDLLAAPFVPRRAVYGFIDRQNLPGLMRMFDFASPDQHSPQRFNTTVPQQALFFMNSPFSVQQAQALAGRPEVTSAADPQERIQRLYRIAFQRPASSEEVALGLQFLAAQPAAVQPSVWQYGYGELDESAGRVRTFQPLAHFTGMAYQGGPTLPDPKLGWVMLTSTGGHAGDAKHPAIRRWTAPQDGVLSVSGTLAHGRPEGNGVQGRILSSRGGVLGTWTAHNGSVETPVQRIAVRRGDVLDFVVDCRGDVAHDSFKWAPVIRLEGAGAAGAAVEWKADHGFGAPATGLSLWERYAQVLLMSNELMFVD